MFSLRRLSVRWELCPWTPSFRRNMFTLVSWLFCIRVRRHITWRRPAAHVTISVSSTNEQLKQIYYFRFPVAGRSPSRFTRNKISPAHSLGYPQLDCKQICVQMFNNEKSRVIYYFSNTSTWYVRFLF